MPVMGGFEATELIRKKEAAASASVRVPIIALTAHAMIGDRERCLANGMVRIEMDTLFNDNLIVHSLRFL